jgi:periplasmic protein TonB
MQALIHTLHIGTLATWLSVAAFGTVGVVVREWQPVPAPLVVEETRLIDDDFILGDPGPSESEAETADIVPPQQAETLPAPPALAPLTEFSPLPEIPDLPPAATAKPADKLPQPRATASRSTASRANSSGVAGKVKTGASGSGSGLSESARLAAGRMPAPSYPPYSRRNGQSGTVVVEFTVDTNGRVISAHAKKPCPWPLLNNEAVSTVRIWRFPPGGIMKLQRPIVFQLR